jgi:hypothetical protein
VTDQILIIKFVPPNPEEVSGPILPPPRHTVDSFDPTTLDGLEAARAHLAELILALPG